MKEQSEKQERPSRNKLHKATVTIKQIKYTIIGPIYCRAISIAITYKLIGILNNDISNARDFSSKILDLIEEFKGRT